MRTIRIPAAATAAGPLRQFAGRAAPARLSRKLKKSRGPNPRPSLEFGKPHPEAHDIVSIQCDQVILDRLTEARSRIGVDSFLGPTLYVGTRGFRIHAHPDGLSDDLAQVVTVAQAHGIRLSQGLPDGGVGCRGLRIGPAKDISEEANVVQFADGERSLHIEGRRHVDERNGGKIRPDQGDVGREARDAPVHIVEWLQVRQVGQQEKGLLEWIPDGGCLG
ncbi:MAG: hypothetical protein OXD30_00930 [Bryobacterales bacterium]|nr:hypothetical protein [Bryobacterales bacterium]